MKKILIVDDIADMRELLSSLLTAAGYDVTAAATGETAMRYVREDKSWALILLDVSLDNLNGFDIFRFIRTQNKDAKVCFVTGKRSPADVSRGVQLGADDYDVKPIDTAVFLKKVRILLGEEQPTESKDYARTAADLPAEILGSPFPLPLRVIELSENELKLSCALPLKPGTLISLDVPKFKSFWTDSSSTACKVKECKASDPGFCAVVEMVGLDERRKSALRVLAIKGSIVKE